MMSDQMIIEVSIYILNIHLVEEQTLMSEIKNNIVVYDEHPQGFREKAIES